MTSSDDNQRFAGAAGEEYRLFVPTMPHYDLMQEKAGTLLAEFALTSDALVIRVLEPGSGTGYTTQQLLKADPRVHITAVDNEAVMLRQAEARLKRYAARIYYVENDSLNYMQQRQPEQFDAVVTGFMLHNLPSPYRRDLMAEIARVLKPGGLYINADKLAMDDPALHRITLEEQLAAFDCFEQQGRPDLKAEWVDHYLRDDQPNLRFYEAEQKALLKANGFEGVETVYRKRMDAIVTARKARLPARRHG